MWKGLRRIIYLPAFGLFVVSKGWMDPYWAHQCVLGYESLKFMSCKIVGYRWSFSLFRRARLYRRACLYQYSRHFALSDVFITSSHSQSVYSFPFVLSFHLSVALLCGFLLLYLWGVFPSLSRLVFSFLVSSSLLPFFCVLLFFV